MVRAYSRNSSLTNNSPSVIRVTTPPPRPIFVPTVTVYPFPSESSKRARVTSAPQMTPTKRSSPRSYLISGGRAARSARISLFSILRKGRKGSRFPAGLYSATGEVFTPAAAADCAASAALASSFGTAFFTTGAGADSSFPHPPPHPPSRSGTGETWWASSGAPLPAFAGPFLLHETERRGRAGHGHLDPVFPEVLGLGKDDLGEVHNAREMADLVGEQGEAMVFAVHGDGNRDLRVEPLADLPAGGKLQEIEPRFLAKVRDVLEEVRDLREVGELVEQKGQLLLEAFDLRLEGGEVPCDHLLLLDFALEFGKLALESVDFPGSRLVVQVIVRHAHDKTDQDREENLLFRRNLRKIP